MTWGRMERKKKPRQFAWFILLHITDSEKLQSDGKKIIMETQIIEN